MTCELRTLFGVLPNFQKSSASEKYLLRNVVSTSNARPFLAATERRLLLLLHSRAEANSV
jgi:hypothetical protein